MFGLSFAIASFEQHLPSVIDFAEENKPGNLPGALQASPHTDVQKLLFGPTAADPDTDPSWEAWILGMDAI
jgi:hypothetical protein